MHNMGPTERLSPDRSSRAPLRSAPRCGPAPVVTLIAASGQRSFDVPQLGTGLEVRDLPGWLRPRGLVGLSPSNERLQARERGSDPRVFVATILIQVAVSVHTLLCYRIHADV
jgi:hypothetical protein